MNYRRKESKIVKGSLTWTHCSHNNLSRALKRRGIHEKIERLIEREREFLGLS